MISVLLADHHELLRKGLRAALDARPEFRVCGEVSSAAEAKRVAAEQQPDVCVVSLTLPGLALDGQVPALETGNGPCKLVIVSPEGANDMARWTFPPSARGFLLQTDTSEEFLTAISAVARGGEFVSRTMSLATQSRANPLPLTSREREVIRWVAEGMRTAEVAELLGISRKTVETHRMAIMRKLQLHSVAQVVRYAIRHRLVEP